MNRRNFLSKVSLATTALAVSNTALLANASPFASKKRFADKIRLKKNDIILFTGDSITDASRVREMFKSYNIPRALGTGYVNIVASKIYRQYPEYNLKIHNTGINGNTITSLEERWDTDCLALKPTVLSILIGVNDFNAAFAKTGKPDPEKYNKQYRDLLDRTLTSLPDIRFVIGEPYAIKSVREKIDRWHPEFKIYRNIAQKIADDYKAAFIPYQEIYEKAGANTPKLFYTRDGVHPSLAGINLMAEAWYSIISG